ncbi:PEP-CTERM sorting domain-containing protein [Niveibacterium sp.]|uniref:PEP-CTERM sorting domain-containing protein n=1 Tax=Niveibacterium sp. TaxID=2017444 RepID=UPI0035B25809
MKRTVLALSLLVGLVGSAAAATRLDFDHYDPVADAEVWVSFQTINGVRLDWTDAALWSTDGVPFSLDSTTFKIDWPAGWGPQPVDDPSSPEWDESKATYWIAGYRNGVEVARVNSTIYTADGFARQDPSGVPAWGEAFTKNLNWTNLDLVAWHSDARSDGMKLDVLSVSGAGITAAVPEPEAYAMMLAGLGITALAARRRKRG